MRRIGILTSSRADYGIYLPLLKTLKEDANFDLNIIAFGTHLSPFHGNTINQIFRDGFDVPYQIESMLVGDSPNAIATAMALTSLKFADFWRDHQHDFDLVFCLGDRYEMFSAIMAAVPYQITFAHLHGGEETSSAIDNVFRHSITQGCKYHFVSCEAHAQRVTELIKSNEYVFNIGALSLDNILSLPLYSIQEFKDEFGIDLSKPTILVTLHPETMAFEKNKNYADEVANTLLTLLQYQVLITLPNVDTNGIVIRERFQSLSFESNGRISCFENLGTKGYFSAMKNCSLIIGNSSSGIIEAASFAKYVVNIGNRQKGRFTSENIINVKFEKVKILEAIYSVIDNKYNGINVYFKQNATGKIIQELNNLKK